MGSLYRILHICCEAAGTTEKRVLGDKYLRGAEQDALQLFVLVAMKKGYSLGMISVNSRIGLSKIKKCHGIAKRRAVGDKVFAELLMRSCLDV